MHTSVWPALWTNPPTDWANAQRPEDRKVEPSLSFISRCSPRAKARTGTCRIAEWYGKPKMIEPTLRQTCPSPKAQAQYAFKDSMIRGILQFTLPIALCCVLHRYGSREIHCVVLFFIRPSDHFGTPLDTVVS